MAKKELVDFLKRAKAMKMDVEGVGRELVKADWSIEDVGEAIEAIKGVKEKKETGKKKAKKITLEAPKAPPFRAPQFPGK